MIHWKLTATRKFEYSEGVSSRVTHYHALGDWQVTAEKTTHNGQRALLVCFWKPNARPDKIAGHINPVRKVILTEKRPTARVTRGPFGVLGRRYITAFFY